MEEENKQWNDFQEFIKGYTQDPIIQAAFTSRTSYILNDYARNIINDAATRIPESAIQAGVRESGLYDLSNQVNATSAQKIAAAARFASSFISLGIAAYNVYNAEPGDKVSTAVKEGVALGAGLAVGAATAAAMAAAGITAGVVLIPVLAAAATSYIISDNWDAIEDITSQIFSEGYYDRVVDYYSDLLFQWDPQGIVADVNTNFEQGKNFVPPPPPRRDPLTLDLDGDGIETIALDGSVLFDHDADGIKQGTGWIASDDGLLVMDRDGNGTIDTGRELFGDNTVKSDGTLAKDGLDALADLDENMDGRIDKNDASFSDLRIWRDLNADGVSQQNELFSLESLDILSINTYGEEVAQDQGDGNLISKVSSFIRRNGSVGSTGSVLDEEQLAGDVDLANDPFFREFTDEISLSEEIKVLPDMQGSGAVRDLRQAAQLNSHLASVLSDYSALSSFADQKAAIHGLLQAWADSAEFDDFVERINNIELNGNVQLQFKLKEENSGPSEVTDSTTNTEPVFGINEALNHESSSKLEQAIAQIRILEAFTGKEFFDFSDTSSGSSASVDIVIGNRTVSRDFISGLDTTYTITAADLGLEAQRISLINQSYDALVDSVYQELLPQTILKEYLDAISLNIQDGDFVLDFSEMENIIIEKNDDSQNGLEILFHLHDFINRDNIAWDFSEFFSKASSVGFLSSLDSEKIILDRHQIGTYGEDTLVGDSRGNVLIAGVGDDVLLTGHGDDFAIAGEGSDTLIVGHKGNNTLNGGSGDDVLSVHRENTRYTYNARDNSEYSNTLEGGTGNDRLEGWTSSDTYVFNRGDGQDVINDLDYGYAQSSQISYNQTDRILLGAGIIKDEVKLRRMGDHLMLIIGDESAGDSITIEYAYSNSRQRIEVLEFADGTTLNGTEIFELPRIGTAANDVQTGSSFNEHISGLAGDDTISGGYGDDQLYGNEGNDTLTVSRKGNNTLNGGSGDDVLSVHRENTRYTYNARDNSEYSNTLEGGTGNDRLEGWTSSDTYVFNRGDGQDVINDLDYGYAQSSQISYNQTDRILLGAGIIKDEVKLRRMGDHLMLIIGDESAGDSITIEYAYSNSRQRIEVLEFADGTTLNGTEIFELPRIGTAANDVQTGSSFNEHISGLAGDDTISGGYGDDQLYGNEGNDTLTVSRKGNNTLNGGSGDDVLSVHRENTRYTYNARDNSEYSNTLEGGTGNDRLEGWTSSDTYVFNRGDGQDVINDLDYGYAQSSQISYNQTDRILLGAGIIKDEVKLRRMGDHLMLIIGDESAGDSITIEYAYSNSRQRIEVLEFADGTTLNGTEIFELPRIGTAANDVQTGSSFNEHISGLAGDDTISGGYGDDQLYGNEGNDTLTVSRKGNNTLNGGSGDDVLSVHRENTRYTYNARDNSEYSNTLEGGTGNDRLEGWTSSDTYVFNRGDGQDVINDLDYGYAQSSQISYNQTDRILLGAGIIKDEVKLRRMGDHLMLIIGDESAGDSITIEYAYSNSRQRIEVLEFADGTTLNGTEIFELPRIGTAANDVQTGSSFNEHISGLAGDDTISGGYGDDQLYGNEGNDTLTVSRKGNNTLNGGSGDDVLSVHRENTRYTYNARDNSEYSNTLEGGTGNDRLEGWTSSDTYVFNRGDGQDVINDLDYGYAQSSQISYNQTDRILLGAGIIKDEVKLRRMGDHLMLIIGDESAGDSITIEYAYSNSRQRIEVLEFADGTTLNGTEIFELPRIGTAANDVQTGSSFNEHISGLAGDDTISGGYGDDQLYGNEGNDTLTVSRKGNNTLNGGSGDDVLSVHRENTRYTYNARDNSEYSNTLEGGTGNDRLEGWTSSDTYVFNRGDGQDVINDLDYGYAQSSQISYNQTDRILLGAGIIKDEVKLRRMGDHLMLIIGDESAGDSITIEYAYSNSRQRIEVLEFADGTTLNGTEIFELPRIGTAANDVQTGSSFNEHISGLAGDDTISGGYGDDQLYGNEGNDTLTVSRKGNNTLNGGSGDDVLSVHRENTRYTYNARDNSEYSNTLEGGTGNDRLEGWTSSDTYVFNRGDGQDVINDLDYGYAQSSQISYNQTDRILLGAGIIKDEVKLRRMGDHLMLIIGDESAGDSITIEYAYSNSRQRIEVLEFADGTTLNGTEIFELPRIGTAANDVQTGSSFNEHISGLAGDDTISGGYGDDQLYGNEGNDTLTVSRKGNNTLNGGSGDDVLSVHRENTRYTYNARDNSEYSNTLEGGTGNDRLEGWTSSDTYVFNRGDGQDVINDLDYGYAQSSQISYNQTDRILLGAGIIKDEVKLRRMGDHLMLIIGDESAGDSITIEYAYSNSRQRIEVLEFADGTTLNGTEIFELPRIGTAANDVQTGSSFNEHISGLAGDDTISGGYGDDQLYGNEGNDTLTVSRKGNNTLNGGSGDDVLSVHRENTRYTYNARDNSEYSNTLEGGTGNDRLEGWTSSDTYVFNRGDGQDVINDLDYGYAQSSQISYSQTDRIIFDDSINYEDLWFARENNDLVISTLGESDSVTIENWYTSSRYQIETIEVESHVLNNTQVDALVQAMAAFDAPTETGEEIPQNIRDQLQPVLTSSWQSIS